MTMTHDRYQVMLGEMIDGGLAEADRSQLMRHLSACADCRDELEAISTLRGDARSLPRGIAPPRDLWSGIAARIDERAETPTVIDLASRRPTVRAWADRRRWAPLAVAAVLLVVASSGITVALMRGTSSEPTVAGASAPPAQDRATTAFAAFQPAEVEYVSAVTALETELAARRGALAPETIEVIEANLAIIDQAIAEARAALEADPSSVALSRYLSGVYRQKVDLLGSAVKMAT